ARRPDRPRLDEPAGRGRRAGDGLRAFADGAAAGLNLVGFLSERSVPLCVAALSGRMPKATEPVLKRFEIIDGMRGYFLVFMLVNHLIFVGGYWMVEVNHRQFAFVEDAQGFVFLSGLLIGMVYARKMLKY